MPKPVTRAFHCVDPQLAGTHNLFRNSRSIEREIRQVQDDTITSTYPSLRPKKKVVNVSKSYRIPLPMAQDLQRVCAEHGLKEESKLIRDFIANGLAKFDGTSAKLAEALVLLRKSRMTKEEMQEVHAMFSAYPSLCPKKEEVQVSKSYRMPLSMVQALERVCAKFRIKDESKLVRDFISNGIARLDEASGRY